MGAAGFFESIEPFGGFAGVVDPEHYQRLPDGWVLAVADVVDSTGAIGDGRYKAVNMAGAAVISAIRNALGDRDLPYVFGGDGALVALAPEDHDAAWSALATVQAWVRDELQLELRAGLVPVAAIRDAGHDVLLARHQVSDVVSYAMVAGGGARWAEAELKAGRFLVPAAPGGARPDLTGLSCRWNPIRSRNGSIVSVIAVPADDAPPAAFGALVTEILGLLAQEDRDGHPVPEAGPAYRWPPAGFAEEAAARAPRQLRGAERRRILFEAAVGRVGDLTGAELLGFDARRHRVDAGHNSDFRKFDDGLKLTVDVSGATARELEALLARAAAAGTCRYGLHRQDEALMTCIIPSFRDRDHVHFIDGAAGGYAMAAVQLKAG